MPADNRPALLLANPHSRRGAGGLRMARDSLARHGIGVEVPEWAPDRLCTVIADHAASVRAVIVAGGDGTLNAAASGLLATGLPLGVMPMGTANDLARTLGIPVEADAAAAVIAAGGLRRIDVGMANDVPFFNIASIGFGVDLTRALTRDSKRRWGTLGYAIAALRALHRMKPFTARVAHAGTVHVSRTVHLAVGNGRHYGGGMTRRRCRDRRPTVRCRQPEGFDALAPAAAAAGAPQRPAPCLERHTHSERVGYRGDDNPAAVGEHGRRDHHQNTGAVHHPPQRCHGFRTGEATSGIMLTASTRLSTLSG